MSHAYALQVCRIVAPEKLSDRFLASGILQQKESPFIGDQVVLAYVLEMTKPWFPSSKVFSTLIETFTEQLTSLKPDKGLADQFEILLRTVNQRLNAISEQGETDWIGNLNGLILVLSGDELHFSQTGHCPTYLLQNNRIRQITDDAQEHEPHPLKTFSNLASGTLHENDYLLVSNQELYREISLDALRRVLNNNTPASASYSIVKELKKDKNLAVSSLIVKVVSRSEAENTKTAETTAVILEDELQSPLKKVQKKLIPLAKTMQTHSKKMGASGLKVAQKASTSVKTNLAPAANKIMQKSLAQAKNLKDQVNNQVAKKPSSEVAGEPQPVVEIILPKVKREQAALERLALQAEERIQTTFTNELPEELPQEEPARPSFLSHILAQTIIWLNDPQHKRISALLAAIVLLIITGLTVTSHRRHLVNTASSNQNTEALQQVELLEKKITSAIALKQDVEASREISDAQKTLNSLSGLTDQQKQQSQQLWATITSQADSLTSTTRLGQPTARYTFPETPTTPLITVLPYFYAPGSTSGLLRSGKGDPTQTQRNIALPQAGDMVTSLAKSSETDTAGYLLTRSNKILRIVQDNVNTTLQPIQPSSGEFATGDVIGSYNGNVYILDSKSGLLWKYVNTGTTYSKGVSIIDNTKYDIKKSLSLAIDGAIYLLKQDGTIVKFSSGQQQNDFALKNLPVLSQQLLKPLQIVTNENLSSLFLLDAGVSSGTHSTAKIIEFNKDGSFVRQFAFPDEYTQISSFDIDPKEKKLWVLSNKEISEFDF